MKKLAGWFEEEISALVQLALRQRLDPVRGTAKVEGRDKSIDNMLLFKEFFSNFVRADPCLDQWFGESLEHLASRSLLPILLRAVGRAQRFSCWS